MLSEKATVSALAIGLSFACSSAGTESRGDGPDSTAAALVAVHGADGVNYRGSDPASLAVQEPLPGETLVITFGFNAAMEASGSQFWAFSSQLESPLTSEAPESLTINGTYGIGLATIALSDSTPTDSSVTAQDGTAQLQFHPADANGILRFDGTTSSTATWAVTTFSGEYTISCLYRNPESGPSLIEDPNLTSAFCSDLFAAFN